jgi:hypothetical protein
MSNKRGENVLPGTTIKLLKFLDHSWRGVWRHRGQKKKTDSDNIPNSRAANAPASDIHLKFFLELAFTF